MKYTETEYIKLWKKIMIKHAIELVTFELEYNIKTRTKTNLDIIKNDLNNVCIFSAKEMEYIIKRSQEHLKEKPILKN